MEIMHLKSQSSSTPSSTLERLIFDRHIPRGAPRAPDEEDDILNALGKNS